MTIGSTFNPPIDQLKLLADMYNALDEAAENIRNGADKQAQLDNACQAVYTCAKHMKVAKATSAEINRLRRIVEHGWVREACNEMLVVYPTLGPYLRGINPENPEPVKRKRKHRSKKGTSSRRQPPAPKNMTDRRTY